MRHIRGSKASKPSVGAAPSFPLLPYTPATGCRAEGSGCRGRSLRLYRVPHRKAGKKTETAQPRLGSVEASGLEGFKPSKICCWKCSVQNLDLMPYPPYLTV